MVLRFLMRYLANNEHLVQRLSESYPVRRAAQIFVLFYMRSKHMLQDKSYEGKITPDQFKALMKNLSHNLRQELKQAQENFRKKS